ncbi:MAG: hypothetical protein Kow00109_14320 [Acidobacteriota bacterium]
MKIVAITGKPALFLLAPFLALVLGRGATAQDLGLTETEYLASPALDVLFFHDFYPEGHQGGVEFIHHGVRIATNGDVRLVPTPEQWDPLPKVGKRAVDPATKHLWIENRWENGLVYQIHVQATGPGTVRLWVELAEPLPEHLVGKAGLNLELLPSAFWEKSYQLGGRRGILPRQAGGPVTRDVSYGTPGFPPVEVPSWQPAPLGRGDRLVLAAEDPERTLEVRALKGELLLLDGRVRAQNGWFTLRSLLPPQATGRVVEWELRFHCLPDWRRPPVLLYSQVGYHPRQAKVALLEAVPGETPPEEWRLERLDGVDAAVVARGRPERWGQFLRYDYWKLDFSSAREPGLYRLRCGTLVSNPFVIDPTVFREGPWEPTLTVFFPVQMDHMEVRDRYRVWHGRSHMDDALQAPVNHEHFDGYRSGPETETNYRPYQHVPGLNRGGWYDAGDYDLAAGSQASTVLVLAWVREEFGVDLDWTAVDQGRLVTEILQPDGVPDLVQQVEHGVLNLLAGYRIAGHAFPGIIANSILQYVHLGDGATKTDNRVQEGKDSDDRWVFTNRSTALEYRVAAALAAASRVLKDYRPELAAECLETAEKAWAYEQSHPPKEHRSAYIPGDRVAEEIKAAVELLLATGKPEYADRLVALEPEIIERIGRVGGPVARVLERIDNPSFRQEIQAALETYAARMEEELAKNPFGVPFQPHVWGIGWNIQSFAVNWYWLAKAFPDRFSPQPVLNVVDYVLGRHPGSSTSLTSGVGAHSLIPAYGVNRADFSYIPGGMASGTALIRPDFPELKEDWPFLWQQAEYVIGGAADYIFCLLAADRLLEVQR